MPVVPLFAILAGRGVVSLTDDMRRRSPRAALGLAVVLLAGLAVNYPFDVLRYQDDGTDYAKLSAVYSSRGEHEKAVEACQKAAAVAPTAPDTLFCFASAYYYKKDYFRAEMSLRATLEAQAGTVAG
jgi:tetratricopeptide (TPR) repeat protein